MALMISVLTFSTVFAAMPNGTVVIGSKAFDLAYANDPANIAEITDAIVAGGAVYVKAFNGSWVDNTTGLTVEVEIIPAVVYKNDSGVLTSFDVGDKDIVTTPTPEPTPSTGGSGGGYSPGEVKSTPTVNVAIAATTVNSGQTLEDSTLSGTFKNTSNVAVTGILTWDIPATIVTATGSFPWTFTPTDITTYKVVKGNVSVSVVDIVSAINAITGMAQVGVELTGGTLTPAGATVSYQWKICDTVDGTYTNIDGATSSTYTPVSGDAGKFIKVEATGTGSYSGAVISAATAQVANAAQVEPTGLAGVAPTSYGLSDGKITGTTALMEYKLSTDITYTAVTGAEITGLAAGIYNVRYAAKTGFNEGARVDVVVAVGAKASPAAPSVTRDDTSNTVTGMTTAMEYKLDSAEYTLYDATTFASLDFSGDHILKVRVAADGIYLASAEVVLEFTTNLISESITSKAITNLTFSTIPASEAKLVSKTITSSNFESPNNKSFTITDAKGDIIPVNLWWNVGMNEYTPTFASAVGSAIESAIQDYEYAKYGMVGLTSRPLYASYTGDTMYISSFATGASAVIKLGGPDWTFFFDSNSVVGTDTNTAANRSFTISDGTKTANITLTSKFASMDSLVTNLNTKLKNASVKAKIEKVDDNHFKIIGDPGVHLTVGGTNFTDFFN